MELQWPLILFTTLLAWCAGTFATQAYLALKGKGESIQMPAWIASVVLLAVGGIAVFFHLQHWERIFNGFGHLSSGITQELIAIVVLAVIAVIYLAMIRRNEGKVPSWLAIASIVVSVVLVVVMGHSYMMEARPAWNNILWIVSLLGASCVLGPATVATIAAIKGEDASDLAMPALIGAVINAVASVAAGLSVGAANSALTDVGYYFDLTHPTMELLSPELSAFSGASALPMILGVIIIGAICPIVAAFMGKKSGNWKMWGPIAVVCAVIGAICLRVVFYYAGVSMFMFY
ncbi:DMSO reductase anchor subunit (DmsC) [Slackia heliotrinireducens]|uniref:DMSO reductase anchor subunit n=1 Tax=Slackia heliotrinireducens (strain ATCC 29202 / DSM 20476 / NCTC 11029 / RHS 1) TaxID=471855 RepID=C7N164_SLAHD|nr:DmsC/YnfH family molybdoenzyme membrane anchor subunit [Slackia heliotrinireducens]ACV23286.1 DMSO reductase anchor subunit [Slackia heliotrinireducens DSM 20476]VEH02460.1 DMSO reductase anchor subunit (DmsC) [Slackia heliotrinireducens]